jgi:two-component system invasion response regulator UvrY
MIRIVLVDDHALVRTGIRSLLEHHGGFEVVAEGSSGEEALQLVRKHKPDILLLDLSMPGMSGLEVIRRLAAGGSKQKVAILTMHTDSPFPRKVLETGALGYFSKGSAAEDLVRGLHLIARGQHFISADIAQQIALSLLPGAEQSPFERLTPREFETVLALVNGVRLQTLADQIRVGYKTVCSFKQRGMRKLGTKTVADLTQLAIQYGLVTLAPSTED